MEVTRRSFLKWGALGGAAVTLPEWVLKALPGGLGAGDAEAIPLKGEERWIPTVCGQCPAGCGLLVRTIAGWPVGVRGNPGHPINSGALCPRGLASLQELYHPDRLRAPLRRSGARGEGRWEEVSWPEAIAAVADKIHSLRADPRALGIVVGDASPVVRGMWQRFAATCGTPNMVELPRTLGAGPVDAAAAMMGTSHLRYELAAAGFVLGVGTDWLQSSPSPVEASRAYGDLRRGRPGRRGRVVSAEPRLSVTAAKADEWIPLQPNTEGLLALGIAHVLVAEGLYDHNFVVRHTTGFEDWTDSAGRPREGLKTRLLRDYSPEAVARVTRVPAETIGRLARDMAANRPAVALCDRVRLHDQMAVLALNALLGSIAREGGLRPAPVVPFSPLPPPTGAPSLSGAATRAISPEVKTVLVHAANPLFEAPASQKWEEALGRVPFVVSIARFMDETAEQADLVLPESSWLESWDGVPASSWRGTPVFGIAQPVVAPFYQTRSAGDVVLELARASGGRLTGAFPWDRFADVLKERARGLFESQRGEPLGELAGWQQEEEGKTDGKDEDATGGDSWMSESDNGDSGEGSWMSPASDAGSGGDSWMSGDTAKKAPTTFPRFWETISRTGGWVDHGSAPGDATRGGVDPLGTPSGRFEFSPFVLSDKTERLRPRTPGRPIELLPHLDAPDHAGDAQSYPLRLVVYAPLVFAGGSGAHLPCLQGVGGAHLGERRWESRAEIHPETARAHDIADDDWVWVESRAGRARLRARVSRGVIPGVVSIALGLGHTACGRWAEGVGANPAALIAHSRDEITGLTPWNLTRVRISRATAIKAV